ncbi:MAG: ATP-dependent DNA helicase RecQ, partial [Myxococcota bacterium]
MGDATSIESATGSVDSVSVDSVSVDSESVDVGSVALDLADSTTLHAALATHFGFDGFRLGQEQLIRTLLQKNAVLGVMPTGAGKSLCFQLPALLLDGVTLVVSPLISLMQDQVEQLTALGIPAAAINSSISPAEREANLRAAIEGRVKLLYVAPERLRPRFVERLSSLEVALLVVDEAHCISQWGHDFRPDYMRLGDVVRELQVPRVAAFTATATAEVRRDIASVLDIPDDASWVFGFHRSNLRFDVVPITRMPQKMELISRYLSARSGQAGIIYAATRKTVERVAHHLDTLGVDVGYYHGGLAETERRAVQTRFMSGELQVMVATNAFGMGVDRSDLRYVIHYELPGSIEALYQEAGRAGRDGLPAEHTLLFTYADTRIQKFFIERRDQPAKLSPEAAAKRAEVDLAKLREVVRYAYDDVCRHERILGYFGERFDRAPCGQCDSCLEHAAMGRPSAPAAKGRKSGANDDIPPRALTCAEAVVVQKILSAMVRARGETSASVIAQALVGSASRKVLESPLVGTRSYGILHGWSRSLLGKVITALAGSGCLSPVAGVRRHYTV